MPERKLNLYPERISEELQKILFYLGTGMFFGFVLGFTMAVILF